MTIRKKLEQVINQGTDKGYIAFFFRSCNNCFGNTFNEGNSGCSRVTFKKIIDDINIGDISVDRYNYFTQALAWLKEFLKVARKLKALGGTIESSNNHQACGGVIRIDRGNLLIFNPSYQHPFSKRFVSGCIVSDPGVMLFISRIHRDYFVRSDKKGVMNKKYYP